MDPFSMKPFNFKKVSKLFRSRTKPNEIHFVIILNKIILKKSTLVLLETFILNDD